MPKQGIHPNYNDINVKCACGNVFQTRSTHKGDIVLEICAAGRVDRFRRKFAQSDAAKAAVKK
jgi:large subunit ribosomal protein L31